MRKIPNTLGRCFLYHRDNNLCVNEKGESLTYFSVYNLAQNSPFSETKRKLVFCLIQNDIAALSGYFALLIADAVPMMVGVTISTANLVNLVGRYRPEFVWLPESRKESIEFAECLFSVDGYCLLYLHNPKTTTNDSLALLLATSGSTGSPKYVRLSHANVYANAKSIAEYLELTAKEIPITTLPPSYSYGLSVLHSHIFVGATIAVTHKTLFDREFWDFFRDIKATSLAGVPFHYEILKKLRFTSMKLPSLRTLTQAGGGMDPRLTLEYAEFCESHTARFFSMYGQTEATARMSYVPYSEAKIKAGSIGIPIPDGMFWLEDESGKIIEQFDSPGELVYQGPNVSMGYADGFEDLHKADELMGILRTGDIATRDSDGYYFIKGRRKRFIKLFGNRISLSDVDRLLYEHGFEVICAGRDNCVEIFSINIDIEKANLIKTLVVDALRVARSAVSVYSIKEFPRSDSGKVQYGELSSELGIFLA